MISTVLGFLSIIIFAIVFYYDFKILNRINEANFVSFAAGVGSVYVFIHMLPQLSHGQHLLEEAFPTIHFTGSQYTIYLIALTGFLFFYMFDTFLTHTRRLPTDEYSTSSELAFYWTNVIFISLYNMLIGYFIGFFFPVSGLVLSITEALLTGAMILSVFKHELPNEQDSKMKAFTIGILSSILLFMLL